MSFRAHVALLSLSGALRARAWGTGIRLVALGGAWRALSSPHAVAEGATPATPKAGYLKAEAAQELDEELMGDYGFSLDQLMELAGLSVAAAVFEAFPPVQHRRVLLLCGPGNNGGDGLVAARHLFFFGYEPVVVYPKAGKKDIYERLVTQLSHLGVPVLDQAEPDFDTFDVVVDALFGFGFRGPPREPFGTLLRRLTEAQNAGSVKVLSVDVPSGWDVALGPHVEGGELHPNALISLTAPKLAAQHFQGRHFVGGRFLPQKLGDKYGVAMPPYLGASQVAELASPSSAPSIDPEEFVAIYVTAPSPDVAERIAGELVKAELAACVNIHPKVTSVYTWEGKVEKDDELLLMIKTRRSLVPQLTDKVTALHPYDVPEVIATPLVDGGKPYFDFLRENTKG